MMKRVNLVWLFILLRVSLVFCQTEEESQLEQATTPTSNSNQSSDPTEQTLSKKVIQNMTVTEIGTHAESVLDYTNDSIPNIHSITPQPILFNSTKDPSSVNILEHVSESLNPTSDFELDLVNTKEGLANPVGGSHDIPVPHGDQAALVCEWPSRDTMNCTKGLPSYYFDPRKESCLYLFFSECVQRTSSFDTGRECFATCNKRQVDKYQPSVMSRGEIGVDTSEDTMLIFDGKSYLSYETFNQGHSNIFDVVFDMKTYLSSTNILSILQETSPGSMMFDSFNLKLKNGKYGVEIICQNWKGSFYMDVGGVQEGAWHMYYVLVNEEEGEILMQLNSLRKTFFSPNLVKGNETNCSFFKEDKTTQIWIGGDFPHSRVVSKGFSGCMTNISIFHSSEYLSLSSPSTFNKTSMSNVVLGTECPNRNPELNCEEKREDCREISSNSKRELRNDTSSLILSMSGNNYLSYRLYNWDERLHTFSNKFSFHFKTSEGDAILFYATGENLESTIDYQFLSVSLASSNQLLFNLNLGGETVSLKLGDNMNDNQWHQVSIIHERETVQFMVDELSKVKAIVTSSENYFMFLDPLIFIGGVPNLNKDCNLPPINGTMNGTECQGSSTRHFYNVREGGCQDFVSNGCGGNKNSFEDVSHCLRECHVNGLYSYNSFFGCLRNIDVNGFNVLGNLAAKSKDVQYYGVTQSIPIGRTCKLHEHIPSISFTTNRASLKLHRNPEKENFSLRINFKREKSEGILATGSVQFVNSSYNWELKLMETEIWFTIAVDLVKLVFDLNPDAIWNEVTIEANGREIRFSSKDEQFVSEELEDLILFGDLIRVGGGIEEEKEEKEKEEKEEEEEEEEEKQKVGGFIGCINQISVDEEDVYLRSVVGSSLASNDVIMDMCQVLDPCERRSLLGPGVTCSMVNDEPVFACEDSEFEGPECNIIKYRKSCEEYRLLGYNESGPFILDIDGPGRMPPANVFCYFNDDGETLVVLDHNVPERYSNVKVTIQSFLMNVTYRDFDDQMLRDLMLTSESCSQEIKFSCGDENKPYKDAWYSSVWRSHIDYLGEDPFGVCHCEGYENCYSSPYKRGSNQSSVIEQYNGFTIRNLTYLPVTSITYNRESNESVPYSEPSLSLGKLVCTNKAPKDESVFFSSASSSLVLSPWTHSSLKFEFRTTTTLGNILYQPSRNIHNPSFQIKITSDKSVEFIYAFKNEKVAVVFESLDSLSDGKWNFIWIDTFDNYFRIILNKQIKIMELPSGSGIQLFDGVLILGYISEKYRKLDDAVTYNAFQGCIQGLITNDEEVNLSIEATSPRGVDVFVGCQTECDKYPCMNGGSCIELWTSHECVCENPFAHFGNNCENDMNLNSITFTSENSEAAYFNSHFITEEMNTLKTNFTFNFRTSQMDALIFVAKDYIQNIIEIYIKGSFELVTLFNFGKEITELTVNTGDISLSEGQSVQVVIQRFDQETTLQVLSRGHTFSSSVGKGLLLLTEEEYEQFPYEMFIGGAKTHGMASELPGLVGCFRGLIIDGKVLNFEDDRNWNFGHGIEMGCTSICEKDKKICSNGGFCINDFNSENEKKYSCNCERTSFVGKTCNEETAYTFNGREDGMALQDWTLEFTESFGFSFGFGAESFPQKDQILVYATLVSKTMLETFEFLSFIDKDQFVQIKLLKSNMELVARHSIKNKKSIRNFVEAKFINNEFKVTINNNPMEISTHDVIDSSSEFEAQNNSLGLIVGGMQRGEEGKALSNLTNFMGCISNLKIISSDTEIWPLRDYNEGKDFIRYGLPKLGSCYVFSHAMEVPVFYDFSNIPEWKNREPEIMAVNIISGDEPAIALDEEYSMEPITTTPIPLPTISDKIWPWALLGSFLFFLLLVFILCLVKRCCPKSESRSRNEVDLEIARTFKPPPQQSIKLKTKEEIPLLEKEPGIHPKHSSRAPMALYGLTPNINEDNTLKMKSEDTLLPPTPAPSPNSIHSEEQTPIQKPKTKVIPINSLNRESNPKIHLKPHLSPDSNSIRHIDSSSEENVNKMTKTLLSPREGTQHSTQIGSFPRSPPSSHHDPMLKEEDSDIDPEGKGKPQSPQEEIDLRKYYLMRKASEPPQLPPKKK